MWLMYNHLVFAAEAVLLAFGVYLLFKRTTVAKTFIYGSFVAVLNFMLYAIPVFYARDRLGCERSILLSLFDCLTATIKQFVGEINSDLVTDYASVYPKYIHIFGIGAVLAVMTSFLAAIGLFGRRFINSLKIIAKAGILNSGSCDIVFGCDESAMLYAKNKKNTILAVEEDEKEKAVDLMEDGYTVLRRNFSGAFFKSRYFGDNKTYNLIFPNNKNNFLETVNTIVSYLESGKKLKKMYFYVEADEGFTEVLQNRITSLDEKIKKGGTLLRQRINFFSRNELIARKLVEAHPITRYMPEDFFASDRSVKEDKILNVFMLGMTPLSLEIYKQFVINNQLVELKNGAYQNHKINYYIADDSNIESKWRFGGLEKALTELSQRKDDYFELPDMPYRINFIKTNPTGLDLDEISDIIKKENSFSFVFIDSGDNCINLEICSKLHLLIGNRQNSRIFVCDPVCLAGRSNNIVSYGDTEKIFNHDVIVDESLVSLAKRINRTYCLDSKKSADITPEDEAKANESWIKCGYFDKYSNIYLANNLRLKLNLLGFDYVKDGKAAGLEEIKEEKIAIRLPYEKYFEPGKENSLLAQEHARWNAYHMLNGYLPLKKSKLSVRKLSDEEIKARIADAKTTNKMDIIEKTAKDKTFKKHICLTSYKGLSAVSETLANLANEATASLEYSAEDFEYYNNDGMLFDIIHEFFEEEKHSIINLNLK